MTKNKGPAAVATAHRARGDTSKGKPINKTKRADNDDEASDADRDWFAANPGRRYRLRLIAASELALDGQRKPPEGSGLIAYAVVRQFRPGLRLRVYFMSPPFNRIENFSDDACETVWLVCQDQYQQMPNVVSALSKGGAA